MGTPVRESILDNILTTLETILTANGYNNNLPSVQRYSQYEQKNETLPSAIIYPGNESCEDRPDPITSCTMSVELVLYLSDDSDGVVATDTYMNSFYDDVKKALKVDITRGGFAQDTRITTIDPFEIGEDNPMVGWYFNVEIDYRHLQTDPSIKM